MNRRFTISALCAWLAAVSLASVVAEAGEKETPEQKTKFIRLERDAKQRPEALQTAVVRYVPNDPDKQLSIDLIGAVHVGDKAYYERLNKQFEQYDVLLYELVAPENARVPKKGESSGHPVAMLQNGMKDMLELEHQLQEVDYQAPNFVHADMTPEEFAKSMANLNESMWSMLFRMMTHQMAQQNKQADGAAEAQLLLAMFKKNRALAFKRVLAEQFEDLEQVLGAFGGPAGSTLITERNKRALAVLKEQIDGGKKKIGIFYGAGHMADMEERLTKEFGVHRQGDSWITAWDLHTPEKRPTDAARDKTDSLPVEAKQPVESK